MNLFISGNLEWSFNTLLEDLHVSFTEQDKWFSSGLVSLSRGTCVCSLLPFCLHACSPSFLLFSFPSSICPTEHLLWLLCQMQGCDPVKHIHAHQTSQCITYYLNSQNSTVSVNLGIHNLYSDYMSLTFSPAHYDRKTASKNGNKYSQAMKMN